VPHTFAAALAASAIVAGVLIWLAFVSVPPAQVGLATTTDGRRIVSDVPIGESAWLVGVRRGMEVEAITPADAWPDGPWTSLAVSDGIVHLTIQRSTPPLDPISPTLSLAALVASIFVVGVAPSVAWWLLLSPTLIGVAVASGLVIAPVSLLLAVAPSTIGAFSLIDPERRVKPWVSLIGLLVSLLVGATWLIAYALRFDSWAITRQTSVGGGVGLLMLGTAAVIRQGFWRARSSLREAGNRPPTAVALIASTLDELTPGRARARLSARERERAAIAGDLHREALPGLAAIIKSVEGGMDPADAAARLRSVAGELRELMTERRLTVLEELGLVPALEWLAERIEERTNVVVELDIPRDAASRLPPEVELHVYRIAQQALDNALVHARPTKIRLSVDLPGDRLELKIADDGVGIAPGAELRALRAGRLGIADMRQRAAAIGGALNVGAGSGGTIVALRWPA
jgi:signal transduction histidine kinase